MHLHPNTPGIHQHRHVRRDDSREVGFFRGIHHLTHQLHVLIVDNRVDGEVALYVVLPTDLRDGVQVVYREVIGRLRAHVQPLYTEVDGVGSPLDGCRERFIRTGGSHNFIISCSVHYYAMIYSRKGTKKRIHSQGTYPLVSSNTRSIKVNFYTLTLSINFSASVKAVDITSCSTPPIWEAICAAFILDT